MEFIGDGVTVAKGAPLGLARARFEEISEDLVDVSADDHFVVSQMVSDLYPGATMFRYARQGRPEDGFLGLYTADDGSWRVVLDGTPVAFQELNRLGNLSVSSDNALDYLRFAVGWCHVEGLVVRIGGDQAAFPVDPADRPLRPTEVEAIARPWRMGAGRVPATLILAGFVAVGRTGCFAQFQLDDAGGLLMQGLMPAIDDLPIATTRRGFYCAFHRRLRTLPPLLASSPFVSPEEVIGRWNAEMLPPRGDSDEAEFAAMEASERRTPLRADKGMFDALLASGRALLRSAVAVLARRNARLLRIDPGVGDAQAYDAFVDHLARLRPTVAFRCDYSEIVGACIEALQGDVLAPRRESDQARASAGSAPPQIRVFDSTQIEQQAAQDPTALRREVRQIATSPNILILTADQAFRLPQEIAALVDFEIVVPRLSGAHFRAVFETVFGAPLPAEYGDAPWARYLIPRDIARAAVGCDEPTQAAEALHDTAMARAGRHAADDAPALEDLEGLGEARAIVENLIADIRAAQEGVIRWSEVDRGMLLAGPPGTGKTTLARAISKACGVRFVLASASTWQQVGHLGEHLKAIRESFAEARNFAPSILFIDEIDSVGSRENFSGSNASYNTAVVNAILEELQGFREREGVIVIGATNNPERVDPALRRAGRLDRVVNIPLPTVPALARIFDYYLRKYSRDGGVAADVDTRTLARLSFGRTGADIEFWVRGARRRARKEGRTDIAQRDLLAEVLNRPQTEEGGIHLTPEEMRRVAVHEAGHAVLSLTGPGRGRDVTYVSIVPRADGALGFVAKYDEGMRTMTRADLEEYIRGVLGGRAAEAVVYGEEKVSSGAGSGPRSDLAIASRIVMQMYTQLGFSRSVGLLWLDWGGSSGGSVADSIRNLPAGEELLRDCREALDTLYRQTQERLHAHRALLDRIVEALIERQEIDGEALRAMLGDRN